MTCTRGDSPDLCPSCGVQEGGLMERVYVVVKRDGSVSCVYADHDQAFDQAARFNADPFLEEGKPDPDAPYGVETWAVSK